MSVTEEIFDAMRRSGMNDWVGGYDPAAVARASLSWLVENLSFQPSDRVLDFGCGIGRTSLLLAGSLTAGGELVGVDIIPAQIRFCQTEISSRLQNTTYYCTKSRNPHYDHLIEDDPISVSEDVFSEKYANNFDLVIASSVFTHFDPQMTANYLNWLRRLTKESGYLCLSFFLDHQSNPLDKRLSDGEAFRNIDNLTYALFSTRLFRELVDNAGLLIKRITYGSWRGQPNDRLKGQHLQDVAILYRPTS